MKWRFSSPPKLAGMASTAVIFLGNAIWFLIQIESITNCTPSYQRSPQSSAPSAMRHVQGLRNQKKIVKSGNNLKLHFQLKIGRFKTHPRSTMAQGLRHPASDLNRGTNALRGMGAWRQGGGYGDIVASILSFARREQKIMGILSLSVV